ncbi:MAG TPA: radical SAM protein [Candidatus Margulisiibacteriota bacterium]|nr:radical SAM protein [Candidatus Margulisiibacteriota bacterium]
MRNILLINPYSRSISGVNIATIEPPLGLGYIASLLELNDHHCQIIDANILRVSADEIHKHIKFSPDIIGISSNIVTHRAALENARVLRSRYREVPIILGGAYPSSLPELALEKTYIDAVAMGEAEITMLELAQRLEKGPDIFSGVEGIAYKEEGRIIFNKVRPLIKDLDSLPFPAYHLLPDLKRYKSRARRSPVGAILTSRGCPYQCTFCNKNIFGAALRSRSVGNIIKEIDWLVNSYGVRQLDILDDNFNFRLDYAKELLDSLIKGGYNLAINLQNGLRIDGVDTELLDKMQKAGVFKISFGIETAAPSVQKRIKKEIDLDKVVFITREARKRKIIVYANFILGLPGDTQESMQQDIDFAIRMSPDVANFMIALPLPGTELYDEVKRNGRFLIPVEEGVEQGFYGKSVFYELGDLKAEDVRKFYKKAYREFYFRLSQILTLLFTIGSWGEVVWLTEAISDLTKNILVKGKKGSLDAEGKYCNSGQERRVHNWYCPG